MGNTMKTYKINRISLTIIHCLTPLLFGGILYILFRSTELRMFKWFSIIEIDNIIYLARTEFYQIRNILPDWVYYSLPDGLWVYSFTSALIIYWHNDVNNVKFWLIIPFVTGIITELLQGFNMFPGTFDFIDLTFCALGISLSKIFLNHKFKQNEKKVC